MRKIAFLAFLYFWLLSCFGSDESAIRSDLVGKAEQYIGTPYKSKLNNGFDCSGFVQFIFSEFGLKIPRSSKEQSKLGKIKKRNAIEIADILIFTGSNKAKRKAGHAAVVSRIQSDTIFFIHATLSKGIIENHIYEPYYAQRYLKAVDFID